MKKETKFVLELEGIDLPDETRKEISEALNNTLMQKIAALDLASKGTKAAPNAASRLGLLQSHLPNGGKIINLLNPTLTAELGRLANVPGATGYSFQTL